MHETSERPVIPVMRQILQTDGVEHRVQGYTGPVELPCADFSQAPGGRQLLPVKLHASILPGGDGQANHFFVNNPGVAEASLELDAQTGEEVFRPTREIFLQVVGDWIAMALPYAEGLADLWDVEV